MENKENTRVSRDQGSSLLKEEHRAYDYDPPAPGRIPSPFRKKLGRVATPPSHSPSKNPTNDGSKKS